MLVDVRKKIIIFSLPLILTFSALACGCEAKEKELCGVLITERIQVPISLLTSRPECFEGKPVEFSGIIGKGYGNTIIFPTETDYKMNNIASTVALDPKMSKLDNERLVEIAEGEYVTVGGRFFAPSHLEISVVPKIISEGRE